MTSRETSSTSATWAIPALLAANIVLACGPWLVRLAERDSHVGPIGSAFWRLTLALPILLIAWRRVEEPLPRPWRGVIGVALLSGLFFALDLGSWHVGLLRTRLANSTLLGNVSAVLFPAYGFIAARRWPTRRQALALALAALGAALLLGRSYELSARNMAGDLICILAGLFYTAYLVAIDRARGSLGPVTTLTLAVAAGVPVLLAFALGLGDPIRPADWTPLILLSLGSQLFGQGLILWSVSRVPPLVVGLMLLVQPIVAGAIGWIVYGERLTAFDLLGAAAVALAVLLVRDARRPLPAREIGLRSEP